jgi:hypothetical protein
MLALVTGPTDRQHVPGRVDQPDRSLFHGQCPVVFTKTEASRAKFPSLKPDTPSG